MYRKKPDVDVVKDIIAMAHEARPDAKFISSLMLQYEERGGLSKKQLEGLLSKASKIETIPAAKLATLEAMIKSRPTRFKSDTPIASPLVPVFVRDERVGELIVIILAKYPQHKRVLYYKAKYENNEVFTPIELSELEKFGKIAAKYQK